MRSTIKILFVGLCLLGLVCGCSPSKTDPSQEARKIVDEFFTAMIAGDTSLTESIIDPSWFEEMAKEAGMSTAEYKRLFLEALNKQIEAKPLKSFTIKDSEKISDTEWEIVIEEETAQDTIEIEKLIVIKIDNKWYLSKENFIAPKEEAPSEVTDVLSTYMEGAIKKDMMSILDLIDPALFNEEAEALGITPDEYKTFFGEAFNKELETFDVKSYSFTGANRVSDDKWEITVEQNIVEGEEEGVAVEIFTVTKIGNRWYIDRDNFYEEDE